MRAMLDQIRSSSSTWCVRGRGDRLKETPEMFLRPLYWNNERRAQAWDWSTGSGNLDYVTREVVRNSRSSTTPPGNRSANGGAPVWDVRWAGPSPSSAPKGSRRLGCAESGRPHGRAGARQRKQGRPTLDSQAIIRAACAQGGQGFSHAAPHGRLSPLPSPAGLCAWPRCRDPPSQHVASRRTGRRWSSWFVWNRLR